MSLATLDADGQPDARMVLLKGVDERGFVFYTNLGSPKASALLQEPRAALCFYWDKIDKQVRVRGRAERVSDAEADAYFATRPRLSQIGAWASKQSQPMRGYYELEAKVAKTIVRFGVGEVPRPPFWSGFRVVPEQIELWKQKPFPAPRTDPLHARCQWLAKAMALSVAGPNESSSLLETLRAVPGRRKKLCTGHHLALPGDRIAAAMSSDHSSTAAARRLT